MADIKKSFNFRNGLQVDDDNFVINANGLVGIGSTIPTEILDVGGNVRIRGSITASQVIADNITNEGAVGTASLELLTVGVTSISSGIITSTGSGIVTYYGDARYLQGMPTSQWVDTDVGLGFTSVYNTGNVGVGTTDPRYTFQVGATNSSGILTEGVGISSSGYIDLTGGINATGVVTATSFAGFGTDITNISAANISTGLLDNARIPTNINKPTGIATFSSFVGSLTGTASTASNLSEDATIDITSIVSDRSDLGITTSSSLNVTGLTSSSNLNVTNSLGVGTHSPSSDIHVRRSGTNAELQVTSDSNTSQIILGNDITATANNTVLQFNDTSNSSHPESGQDCFDIINYAPGNLNNFIRPQSSTGLRFNWINHSTNGVLMSLTTEAKLGLGKTNPDHDFHVVGTSTITSDSFVGGDFSVHGSITGSSLTISGSSTLQSTTFNDKVGIFANNPNHSLQIGDSLTLSGTSGTGVGINTSGNIVASGIITASKFIGIGSDLTLLVPENISSGTISNVSINASSGVVTALKFSGIGSDLTLLDPANITSGTITNVSINAATGVVTTGIVTGATFYGDGSNITSLNPANISGGTFGGSSYTFSPQINVGSANISSLSGNFDAQVGIASEIDRYRVESSYLKSLEFLISFQTTGKVQSSKVLASVVGSGNTFAYTVTDTVSQPSSMGTVELKSVSVGENNYIVVNLVPSQTGIVTYKYTRTIL